MVIRALSLFILIWASLGDWLLWEKGGKLVGRGSFAFRGLKDSFFSGVLLRSRLGDDSLLSLSLSPSVCG